MLGLAASCRSAAKRMACTARELVRERLGQQLGDLVVEARGDRIALEQGHGVEHLERVVVHVEVVEVALLEPAQGAQLRQHDGSQAVSVHQCQPAPDRVGGDDPLELAEHALGRHPLHRRGAGGRGGARRGIDLEVELDRDPDRAQAPQRVLLERALRHHPHQPSLEVLAAAMRIQQLTAADRLGHGVDREVAVREVGVDVVVAQRHEVDVPGVMRPDHPPRAERAAEPERRTSGRARDPLRGPLRVARDREIDVVGGATEQVVAHGPADQPRLVAGQDLPHDPKCFAHGR